MNALESFLNQYALLESRINALMTHLFSSTCAICTACCCRVDICEEVRHSAFLSLLLKQQGRSESDMDERFGWLDHRGCSLEYGRPPICYAYFCDELLARLPEESSRRVVKLLGRLIEYIGENAVGETHLVEIGTASDLEKLDMPALCARLEEAQAGLETVEQYLETGRMSKEEHEFLDQFADPDS